MTRLGLLAAPEPCGKSGLRQHLRGSAMVAAARLLVFLKPSHRRVTLAGRKMAHLGADEVIGESRRNREESAVRDHCDLRDMAMVVAHEPEMGQKGAKVLPAGKRRRFDEQSAEIPLGGDVRVDLRSERPEVAGCQRALRLNHENAVKRQKIMVQHDRAPEEISAPAEDRQHG